ncbi:unnamed protein product, partial [Symbiodinium sp. KB8]
MASPPDFAAVDFEEPQLSFIQINGRQQPAQAEASGIQIARRLCGCVPRVFEQKEMNEEEETLRERRAYRESLRRKRRELEETVGTMDAKT